MLLSLMVWLLSINLFGALGEDYRGFNLTIRDDTHIDGEDCVSVSEGMTRSYCIQWVMELIKKKDRISGLNHVGKTGHCEYVVQMTKTEPRESWTSVRIQDIDECKNDNGGCQHNCNNTYGSYYCTCKGGYALNPNGKSCDDIDECENNNMGCQHICVNTPGSYHCACRAGYGLKHDGKKCRDIDECARKIDGCSDSCSNTKGSYECHCETARHMLPDKRTCEDDYYEVKVMMPPKEWLDKYYQENGIKEEL